MCQTKHRSAGGLEERVATHLVVLLVSMLVPCPLAAAHLQGPARVLDGDTLVVAGERVRLYGIDAPEKAQLCLDRHGKDYMCGQAAGKALEERIGRRPVSCEVQGRDMYGRDVAKCSIAGRGDMGQWLVANGHAVAYRQYSREYVDEEARARAARRGMWAGTFEVPADWRRQHKAEGRSMSAAAGQQAALQDVRQQAGQKDPSSKARLWIKGLASPRSAAELKR